MNTLKMIILLVASIQVMGATTVARPFSFSFYVDQENMQIEATLHQSCRYEKMVWSDSSQYYSDYKDIPLSVVSKKKAGMTEVTVSLDRTHKMKIEGFFKPTKGCYSNISLKVSDTKYSIGWANRFDKAIAMEVRTKQFYKKDDSQIDISLVRDTFENKVLTFFYKESVRQFNVFLYFDGERNWDVFSQSAAKNIKTGLPYLLKKK
ncbi:MAG: hypothetical protein BM556_02990 [Bacteriovorax sp. MedPE-SWde]|nr:MAG: hypothetical protein BM556_02990 [Bacteriovorax sp. MedPE-SWde]